MMRPLSLRTACALLALSVTACVRAATAPPCQRIAESAGPVNSQARAPAWIDLASLQTDEPLALHDLQWVLKTNEESAQEVVAPSAVHPFTLGRWECALSEEQSADLFEAAHLTVARERRLVCTHASGMTVQTELSCGYQAPSPAAEGAPALAGRHTVLTLAEAPALTWSCRTTLVERLHVRQRDGATTDLCVSEGRSLVPCESPGT